MEQCRFLDVSQHFFKFLVAYQQGYCVLFVLAARACVTPILLQNSSAVQPLFLNLSGSLLCIEIERGGGRERQSPVYPIARNV